MKKTFAALLTFFLFLFITASSAEAGTCTLSPNPINLKEFADGAPPQFTLTTQSVTPSWVTKVLVHCQTGSWQEFSRNNVDITPQGIISFRMPDNTVPDITQLSCLVEGSRARIEVLGSENRTQDNILCTAYTPVVDEFTGSASCSFSINPTIPQAGQTISTTVNNIPDGQNLSLQVSNGGNSWSQVGSINAGNSAEDFTLPQTYNEGNTIYLAVTGTVAGANYDTGSPICKDSFQIGRRGVSEPPGSAGEVNIVDICNYAGNQDETCKQCIDDNGIWTALGCIPANPQEFTIALVRIAVGVAGGIAFLMMAYASILILLSSGNPEKLNQGKEIFMSAIAGVLLIVFSAVILRIIGVDILAIPGL